MGALALRHESKIILSDGQRLAGLMIENFDTVSTPTFLLI